MVLKTAVGSVSCATDTEAAPGQFSFVALVPLLRGFLQTVRAAAV